MAWTAKQLTDQTGRLAVVTGANSGVGFHTAKALVERGAEVVLACRNTESAAEAAAKMTGRGTTRVEKLDLASQADVKGFTERWEGPIDLLIDNAGVMRPPSYRETEDGFELQFATNHLGHHTLVAGLMPSLLAASSPRVVSVASIAHHGGDERVVEANPAHGYDAGLYYAQTKLANVLFARELQRRATEAGVGLVSTAAHPGVSATNLVASSDGMGANPVVRTISRFITPVLFQSAAAGADPSLYAATEAEPGSYTGPQRMGESRGPIGPAKLSRHARNDALAGELWEKTVELTGLNIQF